MEKVSVQYSEFDRLYASKLKLAANDEDIVSTRSFISKRDSETSADSAEMETASDPTEGTAGCIEQQTDPKADITELIIADKHRNHESKVVDSANIPSQNALAEFRQLPECASIGQLEEKPPDINIDFCLSPRQGYFHFQQDTTDDNAVLDDVLPENVIDSWDVESSSGSEQ